MAMAEKAVDGRCVLAWFNRRAHVLFWMTVAIVVALDLSSKWAAFKYIPADSPDTVEVGDPARVVVIPDVLELTVRENRGAVFGLGQGSRWLLVAASFLAAGFIVVMFSQTLARQRFLHVLLAFSLGGAIGNLYDRLLFGHVRDMIAIVLRVRDIYLWPWIFNIADVALVVGIGLLLVGWVFGAFDLQRVCSAGLQSDDKAQEAAR